MNKHVQKFRIHAFISCISLTPLQAQCNAWLARLSTGQCSWNSKKKIGKDVQGGVLRRLSFLLLDTLVVMQRAMRHGIFEDNSWPKNINLGSRFSIFLATFKNCTKYYFSFDEIFVAYQTLALHYKNGWIFNSPFKRI